MTQTSKIEKRCTKCHTVYPATANYFHKNRSEASGLNRWCKECRKQHPPSENRKEVLKKYHASDKAKAIQRKYRQSDKGKARSRRAKLKYYYQMQPEEYDLLYQQQNGRCGICGKPQVELRKRLYIDHDHTTGEVRGLLCNGCNRHLGKFEKGHKYAPDITERMNRYLQKNTHI